MMHPYKSQSDLAFWSRSVSNRYSVAETIRSDGFLVRRGERVASAGSCFASNIVPYLEQSGIEYLRTEKPNPVFKGQDFDNFRYSNFSAGYGNIYTPRQLLQLIQRANGYFHPMEDRWHIDGYIVDPFRPGLKFRAKTDQEFDALLKQHFARSLDAFARADVFVFTLGLTEAWVSAHDGAVFPACPGTVAGDFDPTMHVFKNFTVSEITKDICDIVELMRDINPQIRFILTVSPVPLIATATDNHVLVASVYSKAVLRVAADEVSRQLNGVTYFPAFEIVTGPQAPKEYFETDRRNVSVRAWRR